MNSSFPSEKVSISLLISMKGKSAQKKYSLAPGKLGYSLNWHNKIPPTQTPLALRRS